jgi:assimilatory nitrate reductase catalytic subunit
VAEVPVDPLRIIEQFGPHLSAMTGVRLSTSVEPDRLVKTHCCFCGQQCGIQLKVRENQVIGFEPWEDFPFNRGMLCPKGVKRYLQGSHPDRLTTALRRDTASPSGFSPLPYAEAINRVASEIGRIQQTHGAGAIGVLGGASLTTEKTYLLGKFARVCLKTPFIDYNGRLCMVSAGAANKKAFGIDRTTNPWSDMVGSEVIWVAGSNVAECSPITTNYIWQAREQGARIIVQDPRITPAARTCDLYLPVKPGRDAALFAGVLQIMIERDWLDHAFIDAHTIGFEQVAEYCREWTLPRTAEVTGVPQHLRTGAPTAGPPRRPLTRIVLDIRGRDIYAVAVEERTI